MEVKLACAECSKPFTATFAICGLCLCCLLKHEEKVTCSKCGRFVKAKSCAKRNGSCLHCSAKRDSFFRLYSSLIERVCRSADGYQGLSDAEKLYFVLTLFQYEVNDNGFLGFLFSRSCTYHDAIESGLAKLHDPDTLALLTQARRMVFPRGEVPLDKQKRRSVIPDLTLILLTRLNELDHQFYDASDSLSSKLEVFAREHGLLRQGQ